MIYCFFFKSLLEIFLIWLVIINFYWFRGREPIIPYFVIEKVDFSRLMTSIDVPSRYESFTKQGRK